MYQLHNIIKRSPLLFITLLFYFSCTTEPQQNPSNNPYNPNGMEEIITDGTENYSTLKSEYIFDQERLHTFELTIPEENLDFLNDDPAREEYVDGKLTFEGEEIAIIGIRYKGSIGGFVNCLSGNNWANPSGRKICTKLSMKLKINYADKDKKFYVIEDIT